MCHFDKCTKNWALKGNLSYGCGHVPITSALGKGSKDHAPLEASLVSKVRDAHIGPVLESENQNQKEQAAQGDSSQNRNSKPDSQHAQSYQIQRHRNWYETRHRFQKLSCKNDQWYNRGLKTSKWIKCGSRKTATQEKVSKTESEISKCGVWMKIAPIGS